MAERLRRLWRRNADYRAVFGSDEGKRVLADLCRFCHVAQPVFVPGDALTSAYRDGMRRVALRVAAILGMSDRQLLQLAQMEGQTDD